MSRIDVDGSSHFGLFTLKVYAQATKRRDRLSGAHLKAYDRALDWARMGTSDALTVPVSSDEATITH